MSRPGFGTDGVRGIANVALTPALAMALGRAVVRTLKPSALVVGRDTRLSGPLLKAAFSAGAASEGADVIDLGVFPTAGVAFVAQRDALVGVVISASHNPYPDNGIKVISATGTKLTSSAEEAIERSVDEILQDLNQEGPTGKGVGTIFVRDEKDAYIAHLLASLEGRNLGGAHIIIDCANGAASDFAQPLFEAAGAKVTLVAFEPDGTNINAHCGATTTKALCGLVREGNFDLGLALDGDADRLVAVDAQGNRVDGDALLALFANDHDARGLLDPRALVVTVMANLGFRRAMGERNISLIETPVGDRYVQAALDEHNITLGGEQSGHIIFRRSATTGDGLLSALALCDLVQRSGKTLHELAHDAFEGVPQLLHNVAVKDPFALVQHDAVCAAVKEVEIQLGSNGRVLVRASGTEPLVRVMVEALDGQAANAALAHLVAVVEETARGY